MSTYNEYCKNCKVSGGHKPCWRRHLLETVGTCPKFVAKNRATLPTQPTIGGVFNYNKNWKDENTAKKEDNDDK